MSRLKNAVHDVDARTSWIMRLIARQSSPYQRGLTTAVLWGIGAELRHAATIDAVWAALVSDIPYVETDYIVSDPNTSSDPAARH
jgi:hypothetical protein